MEVEISCQGVWKVFGPHPRQAIKSIKERTSKEEVLKETGHIIALRNVSFEVQKGEVFVIMGLSGCGKSTLARCLNRLIEPTQGKILFAGTDIAAMNAAQLRKLRRHQISMVFQHFSLFPHRPVIDNVSYGLEVQGLTKNQRHEKAMEVIELVGLKDWENSYPSELSGGMQQRVGLARALVLNPRVLLMDEPFSALDPMIRRQMQDEFLNLITKVRKTIVFITHDFSEALKMGKRIAIMKDGAIVQAGSPEEIVMTPATEYVEEFVRDVPRGKVVPVRQIMREPALSLYEWQGTMVALYEMRKNNTTYAFVVDVGRRLKGRVTIDEVRQGSKEDIHRLDKIIKKDVPKIGPDQTLEEILPLAAASEYPIAVVDQNEKLIGEVPDTRLLSGIIGEQNKHNEEKQK